MKLLAAYLLSAIVPVLTAVLIIETWTSHRRNRDN